MNAEKVTKAAVVWMSIIYIICTLGVTLFPELAKTIMQSVFHGLAVTTTPEITLTSAVTGLIYLDIFTVFGAYLFAVIYNRKK